jgi:CRP/FNR family transcriptional regulator, cyclic AMP receptor protein
MDNDDIAVILGNVDMFVGLNPRALKRLARAGHVVTIPAGSEVVHAGDPVTGFRAFSPEGAEMHVILKGTATVHLNGEVIRRLSADDYFGELALIDGKPRTADVIAGPSGLTTWALPKWEFDSVVTEHPEVLRPILQVVVDRLRRAEAAAI